MAGKFNNFAITDWKTYALTIGAQTTAPTKGTIVTDIARFRVLGKVLHLNYFLHTSTVGAGGSGTYLFPLPSGFTIDTVLAPPTTVPNQFIESWGVNLGAAFSHVTNNVNDGVGFVSVFDGTHVIMGTLNGTVNTLVWVGSGSFSLVTPESYSFDAQIPIL